MKAIISITKSGLYRGDIYNNQGKIESACLGNTVDYILRWLYSKDIEYNNITIKRGIK